MKVDFIRDLPIPDYGEWTDDATGDWMHPCHGPLPHNVAILRCLGGEFVVALWSAETSLLTLVDICDEPEGRESEAFKQAGPTPRTYRWRLEGGSFYSTGRKYTPPRYGGSEEAWRRCVCRQIMMESVILTIEHPIGMRIDWAHVLRPADSYLKDQPR